MSDSTQISVQQNQTSLKIRMNQWYKTHMSSLDIPEFPVSSARSSPNVLHMCFQDFTSASNLCFHKISSVARLFQAWQTLLTLQRLMASRNENICNKTSSYRNATKYEN